MDYVGLCCAKIVEKLKWKDSNDWLYSDFESLSELIYNQTKVRINARTLRRLFRKEKSVVVLNPQINTKNALAQFLGYKDWADFILMSIPNTEDTKRKVSSFTFSSWLWVTFIGILALGVLLFLLFQHDKEQTYDYKNTIFKADKTVGNYPLSVKFTYHVDNIQDNLYFSQALNSKKIKLNPADTQIIYSYKVPGMRTAQLFHNDKELAQQKILVTSDDWQALLIDRFNYYPVAIDTVDYLSVSEISFQKLSHVVNVAECWIKFIYFHEFDVETDEMYFETRLKDADNGLNPCPEISIRLYGDQTRSAHQDLFQLHFVPEGCSNYLFLNFSNVQFKGSSHDLFAYERDITNWQTYGLRTSDGIAYVYFNHQLIDSIHYDYSLGKLIGMDLKMKYDGFVDYVILKEGDSLIYQRDF